MQRVLRPSLLAVLLMALFSASVRAQEPGAEVGIDGDAAPEVFNVFTTAATADAFELELAFDPGALRIEGVEAGPGWSLVPQAVQVDKAGIVTLAGFTVDEPCVGSETCTFAIIRGMALGGSTARPGIVSVDLLQEGVAINVDILDPAQPREAVAGVIDEGAGPVEEPAGGTPPQQVSRDDDAGFGPIALWFLAIAAGLVAVSTGIVAGSRWLWNHGDRVSMVAPAARDREEEELTVVPGEAAARFGSFLDRVQERGASVGGFEDEEPDDT